MEKKKVWVLLDPNGKIVNIYYSFRHAELDIPSRSRSKKIEFKPNHFNYGIHKKYELFRMVVKDSGMIT